MNNNGLTVKEYADLMGISTTAVYKRIKTKRLETFETVSNGRKVLYINISAEELPTDFQPRFETNSTNSTNHSNQEKETISELAAVIEQKDKEIEELKKRVEELTNKLAEQNNRLMDLITESHVILQTVIKNQVPPMIDGTAATDEQTEQKPKPHRRHFWQRKKD